MSRKTDLQDTLKKARSILDDLSETVKTIQANPNFSDVGKADQIKQVKTKAEQTLAQIREQAQGIISRASVKATKKPDTMQPAYQMAYGNALKTVQLAGNKLDAATLQNLCRPFSGDPAAEAALRAAYTQANKKAADSTGIRKALRPKNGSQGSASEGNGGFVELFPDSVSSGKVLTALGHAQNLCNDLTPDLAGGAADSKPWNAFRNTGLQKNVSCSFMDLDNNLAALNDDLTGIAPEEGK